jgi:DNA-binding NarL/FixJ family response regulator
MIIEAADTDLVLRLRRQYPKASFIPLDQGRDDPPRGGALASSTAPPLTVRQDTILQLLRKGLSNKEIARTLAISPFTVRNHVSMLLRILEVATRQEAAKVAGPDRSLPSP